MASAARGRAALEASDYPKALSHFTLALIDFPTSPDNYLLRSTAFARLTPPRYDLALQDAEYAVAFAKKREKREKILASQQRRAVALFGLGKYADAKFILTSIHGLRPADSKPSKMEGDMWLAKVERKLNDLSVEDRQHTATEYPDIRIPADVELKATFQSQLNPDKSFRFPEEGPSSSTLPVPDAKSSGTPNAASSSQTPTPTTVASLPPSKLRHEWYQNPQSVTLTIYAKGVPKDAAKIDISNTSVSVSFPHPSNLTSTFDFSLDPLFALIDASQSRGTVMSTKIELVLRKAVAGQKWPALEGNEPLTPANGNNAPRGNDPASVAGSSTLKPSAITSSTAGPSYPTSSRNGPKNWDKLASDLHAKSKTKRPKSATKKATDSNEQTSEPEAEDEIESDFEGGDDVDAFFKKLYAGSDEDTRRAMMKSFYESNGTALSTNWSDVGKRTVDEVKSKDD